MGSGRAGGRERLPGSGGLLSDPAVLGLSVPFTISAGGAVATIGVKSPSAGETWEAGGSYPVSWNWTGAPGDTVSIALVRGGSRRPDARRGGRARDGRRGVLGLEESRTTSSPAATIGSG